MLPTTNPSVYNFPVALRPVFDEFDREIPRVKSVTRTDTRKHLAIVSDRYKLIKHERMIDAFEPFARALGGVNPDTQFFQEKDGARVIVQHTFRSITFNMPGHNIPGVGRGLGDVVALRTWGTNSYNTTTPLTLRVGCLVLRCMNGATAMDSIFGLNIKHVGHGEPEINLPTPEAVIAAFQRTGRIWEQWADLTLRPHEIERLTEMAAKEYGIASPRDIEKEKVRFQSATTVWDIYNAFTYVIGNSSRRIQETSRLNRLDRLNIMISSYTAVN
jgi:hypothetical protein